MKIEIVNSFDGLVKYLDLYKYVIINISAPWCKPCREIKPKLEKFISVIDKNEFIYLKIDYDLYASDANFESLFNVSKIPYFCIMKDKIIQFSMVSGDFLEVSSNLHRVITLLEAKEKNDITNDNDFNIKNDF
jgi:thiol-disulfide isomerase/thioredoxin